MTSSNPDFIHLIESKRFQTSGISSPKNQARQKEQQKAYSNELISLRLVPPSSSLALDNTNDNNASSKPTTWNIPRYRLTLGFLTETVNRGRNDTLPKLHVTHLIDSRSKDVILPSNDLRVQCRSTPVVYDVVTQLAGGIKQGGVLARSGDSGDSYYNGDMLFLITNVPKQSSSELFDVQPVDVHRWLVECATSSVEKIMIANDKIQGLNETLQQLEKTLANVHRAPMYNDKTGRAITGEALQLARENKRTSLLDEQEQTKNNLAAAEQALNELRLKHLRRMEMELSIKKRNDVASNNSNKMSFSVKLHGKKKEYYTDLITKQKVWSLPMYATGSGDLGNNSTSNDTALVLADIMASKQAQHFVDTSSVSIVVLPGEWFYTYLVSICRCTIKCQPHSLFYSSPLNRRLWCIRTL